MMLFSHYLFQFVGAAIAVVAGSFVASAQMDPTQPLRIIVPCAVGTPTDLAARLLAKEMLETSGRQTYVDNFTAGAGPIDIDTVNKLIADDRSMLFNLGVCDN